jgi:nanoRNase/pAp phosphatase (c-di-AMP/oligoRNAs hydrolase)
MYMDAKSPAKADIRSIAEKNKTALRIADALLERDGFLLIGHRNPDEDCIASMVAFGLLASKLSKDACIYVCGHLHEQFSYLLNICTYNAIGVISDESQLPKDPSRPSSPWTRPSPPCSR